MKEKIKQLEKELAELKAEFEKSQKSEKWQDKLVQPKNNNCYFIGSDVKEGLTSFYSLRSDGGMVRKPEHVFANKEQAELVKEKMLLMQEMLAFAHVKNEGWKPDWKNGYKAKYGITISKDIADVDSWIYANGVVFGITVKSKEIAKEMLSIFGERIEKYYNEQY